MRKISFLKSLIVGFGQSSYLCLQGKIEYERALKSKIPLKKLLITGNPANDQLFKNFNNKENLRKEFCIKHNISNNEKLLIIALPQYKEHSLASDQKHWEIINNICESISPIDCHTFLSLHPKMKKTNIYFWKRNIQ